MTDRPVLRRGDRGERVRELQQLLVDAGFDVGPVDGIFGGMTHSAVAQLQADRGLDVDGVVGRQTWAALLGSGDQDDGTEVPEPPGAAATDWTTVAGDERMRMVMELLVERYGFPVAGAGGVVGNLWAESGVIPSRIEGSSSRAPLRARDFSSNIVDFTPREVMNRDRSQRVGPALPGVGLAQWTSQGRRDGLFRHRFDGNAAGPDVLFDMEAQVDYLVHELRGGYRGVHAVVIDEAVSVDTASDEVVYGFEVPGAVLDGGTKLPRTDPRVRRVFEERRVHSQRAARVYAGAR